MSVKSILEKINLDSWHVKQILKVILAERNNRIELQKSTPTLANVVATG